MDIGRMNKTLARSHRSPTLVEPQEEKELERVFPKLSRFHLVILRIGPSYLTTIIVS